MEMAQPEMEESFGRTGRAGGGGGGVHGKGGDPIEALYVHEGEWDVGGHVSESIGGGVKGAAPALGDSLRDTK